MDENPAQSFGFISRLKNRLSQVNQRTAFDAFLILLIVVGLIATVFLAGQRQIFRSGASQEGRAEVLDKDGNPPPKDESGNPVVETQQIRIKIEFPTDWSQSLLPKLINPAYAIHTVDHPLCGAKFPATSQGKDTICADSGGGLPGRLGKTCGAYVGGYDTQDCPKIYGENYKFCFVYDPCPATAPTSTPIPTQPPAQQSCPGQCASPKDQNSAVTINGSTCTSYLGNSAYDTDCRSKNTGYNWCYTSCAQAPTPTTPPAVQQPTATPAQAQRCGTNWEGKRTQCSADDKLKLNEVYCTYLDAWSRPLSEVCSTSTPFCWACPESASGAPAQPTPTATPAPTVDTPQPPTVTPEPEQTEWIRISLNENNVKSGNCFREPGGPGTGSSNPREHCMEFSITDPYFTQRGNMADLWLPNQPGLHTIYIGFVSNKGNLKPNPLSIKVNYKPKASPVAKTTPTQPAGKECTSDADPNGFARFCVNRENRDRFKNACSGGELNVGYNCPSQYPYCLIGSDAICSPQPVDDKGKPIIKKGPCPEICVNSLTLDKNGRTCSGKTWSSSYSCPDPEFPICITKSNCVSPGPLEKDRVLCTNVLSACLGNAGSRFKETQTRCNSIYTYCINGQGYKNQKQLWHLLSNECLQQEQECKDAFITGGLFGGNCSAQRDRCNDRIRSLGLTQSP